MTLGSGISNNNNNNNRINFNEPIPDMIERLKSINRDNNIEEGIKIIRYMGIYG